MSQYQPIPLLICDGNNEDAVRNICRNAWMGFAVDHVFYGWQRDMTPDAIVGRRVKNIFDTAVNAILVLCVLGGVGGVVYELRNILSLPAAMNVFETVTLRYERIAAYVLVSGFSLLFFLFRFIHCFLLRGFVSHHASGVYDDTVSWETVSKIHERAFHDMSAAWEPHALRQFEDAVLWSRKHGIHCTVHVLFWHILATSEAKNLLVRFELAPQEIERLIRERFVNTAPSHMSVVADRALWQVVAHAYRIAAENRDPKVDMVHLLHSIFEVDAGLPLFFETLGVPLNKLQNGLAWIHFFHRLRRDYIKFRRAAFDYNVSDVGAAMTGLATPLLNSISRDLTKEVVYDALPCVVSRAQELNTLMRVFESGGSGAILVGPQGVGKMSIIEGLAHAMVEGRAPEILKNKRLLVVPISQVIAGNNPSAYYMRLTRIMSEAAHSGNIVLAFDGIEGICGVRAGGETGHDLADTFAEIVERTGICVVATGSLVSYRQVVFGTKLGSSLTKIDVTPVSDDVAIQIIESRVPSLEYTHDVFFSYESVVQCVQMARKFLQDEIVPESALKLAQEVAVYARNTHGKHSLVRGEDVGVVVAEKSHIPTATLAADEREKLLRLETLMHERVIGQDEAVSSVAAALRRARTGLHRGTRPIAAFLFLGPTGVGKTETAKTLAKVYFGGDNRMIRFDMSEFQDSRGVYRLIGEPNMQGTGMLTEAVRSQPFSLLLLDEFEKADSGVLNLFLQVMDDGRLTDSVGRVTDFSNTMIIATSNAGSQFIQDAVRGGQSYGAMRQALYDRELKDTYRPELLNRFDGVIVFTPLTLEQIEEVAHIMVGDIGARLYEREGIALHVTDAAVVRFATLGYSPEFGVRPLRRVMQTHVEDKIAEILLRGSVHRNQIIRIDVDGKVTIV